MSDYLNLDLQWKIMENLPVKSLIRFTAVSKGLSSLIKNPRFIADHTALRHNRQFHFLIENGEGDCVGFLDNDNFHERYNPNIPPPFLPLDFFFMGFVGGSHGLIGAFTSDLLPPSIFVLWNPSTRRTLAVPVDDSLTVTFGVCPVTLDPKIITIDEKSTQTGCMLYTVSSKTWKNIHVNLGTDIHVRWEPSVVTPTYCYWLANVESYHKVIVSFNFTTEVFQVIGFPVSLGYNEYSSIRIHTIKESLAVAIDRQNMYSVWVLEENAERSFIHLFTFENPCPLLAFTKNGSPIMAVGDLREIAVYEPNLEQYNALGISGDWFSIGVNKYVETLVLLDQQDSTTY